MMLYMVLQKYVKYYNTRSGHITICTSCNKRKSFHKDGLCYWCRRLKFFNIGNTNLTSGKPLAPKSQHDLRNTVYCKYPNCTELIPYNSNTVYCIPHRVQFRMKSKR